MADQFQSERNVTHRNVLKSVLLNYGRSYTATRLQHSPLPIPPLATCPIDCKSTPTTAISPQYTDAAGVAISRSRSLNGPSLSRLGRRVAAPIQVLHCILNILWVGVAYKIMSLACDEINFVFRRWKLPFVFLGITKPFRYQIEETLRLMPQHWHMRHSSTTTTACSWRLMHLHATMHFGHACRY